MRFVRSLSDALKFRPWLRFRSLVCISSGCGRFVALWGFCCVVCGLWAVSVLRRSLAAFQVCRLWSDALRPCLAPYFVRYGLLFCFVGSSSPVVLFSFCGPLDALQLLAAVPLLGVVVVSAFGYGLPVVFSASFWDPVRLLLFSWFYIPGGGCRSRCRSPRRVGF